jgi:hypothetical protein
MKVNSVALAASYIMSAAAFAGPEVPGVHQRPTGTPSKLEDFEWADPFSQRKMKKFVPACDVEKTFKAREYLLDDLQEKPPKGLSPWADALKKIFKGRPYPGSWDGIDPHGMVARPARTHMATSLPRIVPCQAMTGISS